MSQDQNANATKKQHIEVFHGDHVESEANHWIKNNPQWFAKDISLSHTVSSTMETTDLNVPYTVVESSPVLAILFESVE
ncbi:MAG: hypothetical protein WC805_00835 [Patescibacteria group bacterium]|jgi:hypothetical protein